MIIAIFILALAADVLRSYFMQRDRAESHINASTYTFCEVCQR